MGNWVISVHGTGAHHNGNQTDADAIAKSVVLDLLDAGQQIEYAKFVSGASTDLLPTEKEVFT